MIIALISVLSITIIIDCWGIYWLRFSKREQPRSLDADNLPFVTILLAARNEEDHIGRCLQSLINQDYPHHLFEILVGNDSSTDRTAEVIASFQNKYPQIKSFLITQQPTHQQAKANVLLQLAQQAQGEYYFITDADMALPPTWLKGLLCAMEPNTGIVTGFTAINPISNFAKLQDIDWTFALGLIKVVSDQWRPVTSMGNNMVISKTAYQSVGGYEQIPFSITEDYELFRHVTRKGYKPINLISKEVEGVSNPQPDWRSLLKQRRRWLVGAFGLNIYMWIVLLFQAVFFPVLILLFAISPFWGLGIFASKILAQSLFIHQVLRKLGKRYSVADYLQYEVYSMLNTLALLIYSIFTKVEWKGRKF